MIIRGAKEKKDALREHIINHVKLMGYDYAVQQPILKDYKGKKFDVIIVEIGKYSVNIVIWISMDKHYDTPTIIENNNIIISLQLMGYKIFPLHCTEKFNKEKETLLDEMIKVNPKITKELESLKLQIEPKLPNDD